MRRRRFLTGAVLVFGAGPGLAQAPRQARIGMISPAPLTAAGTTAPRVVKALAALGYRDGERMKLEFRAPASPAGDYSAIARELAGLRCDVVIAIGPVAPVRALQEARAAAIVFVAIDYDPVEKGIVSSLRQPDRGTTGVYVPQSAHVAKRLELMREIVPQARNVLVLVDEHSRDQLPAAQRAAEALGLRITLVEMGQPSYDFAAALEAGRKAKVDGMVLLTSPVFFARREELRELLLKHRMIGIGGAYGLPNAGYVLDLSPDPEKMAQRTARIATRVVQGARPAELPVEQADEVDLAINHAVARTLGVKIPDTVVARASRLIE